MYVDELNSGSLYG